MSKGIIEHSRNLNSNISDIIIYNNFKKKRQQDVSNVLKMKNYDYSSSTLVLKQFFQQSPIKCPPENNFWKE